MHKNLELDYEKIKATGKQAKPQAIVPYRISSNRTHRGGGVLFLRVLFFRFFGPTGEKTDFAPTGTDSLS